MECKSDVVPFMAGSRNWEFEVMLAKKKGDA